MLNSSQINYVQAHLLQHKEISRNHCLSLYISRLGSIIHRLKKSGMDISGDYKKVGNGKDFVYRLLNAEQLKSQGNCTTNADSLQEVVA